MSVLTIITDIPLVEKIELAPQEEEMVSLPRNNQ